MNMHDGVHVCVCVGVLTSLRHLSTTTSILTDPAGVPQQATDAVSKRPWLPAGHYARLCLSKVNQGEEEEVRILWRK